jgi:hypothetical protein
MIKQTLVYGNCQAGAIANMICSSSIIDACSVYCVETMLTKTEFTDLIKKSDIIITQPIDDDYRGKDYLSTSYILENCNDDCEVVILPSLYFNFYYFDSTTIKLDTFEPPHLIEPVAYHYTEMMSAYIYGLSVNEYINNYVNNIDFRTKSELISIATDSISILRGKEQDSRKYAKLHRNVKFVNASDYIENNYKNKLLFYSVNHPTYFLLSHIVATIFKCVALDTTDVNLKLDPLSNNKLLLYSCIQKAVDFDITEHKPKMKEYTEVASICNKYYEAYECDETKKYIKHYVDENTN